MRISSISSQIISYKVPVYRAEPSTYNNGGQKETSVQDNNSAQQKKKNNAWKYLTAAALFLALIADIIVERKARMDEKAKFEALKNEKELMEQMFKEAEQKSKKLEDDMEALDKFVENLRSEADSKNELDKYKNISQKIEKAREEARKRNSGNNK